MRVRGWEEIIRPVTLSRRSDDHGRHDHSSGRSLCLIQSPGRVLSRILQDQLPSLVKNFGITGTVVHIWYNLGSHEKWHPNEKRQRHLFAQTNYELAWFPVESPW